MLKSSKSTLDLGNKLESAMSNVHHIITVPARCVICTIQLWFIRSTFVRNKL